MEEKFIQIFSGFSENYGQADMQRLEVDPISKKQKPEYRWAQQELTDEAYKEHLVGTKSIGIQPCNEKNHARFGAIDIDPQEYINFDRKFYLDKIKEYDLPIIPILSKSGGLHLYVFTSDFIPAKIIRSFLTNLIPIFNLKPETEVFPKQTELVKDNETGEMNKGNFINLPYFKKTERRALNYDGTEFTFEQFIKVVEENFITAERIKEIDDSLEKKVLEGSNAEFSDGPPCLAALSKNKLSDGRDRFLYNYMVFAKKKYPDDWEKMVIAAPGKYFQPGANGVIDWTETKTKQKLKSWARETKGHTCNEDPIQPVCMKAECRKRKFGYLSDKQRVFPGLSGLQKITYPEPQYTFNVTLADGQTTKEVRAKNIKQIIELDNIRAIIGAAADMIPPKIKQNEFQDILDNLFPPKLTTPPPKGTTPDELLEEYLSKYLNGPKAGTYAAFKTGAVLIEDDQAFFIYSSFFDSLKNKEWKEERGKTAEHMTRLFNADFTVGKRFPKKSGDKGSNPAINVVKVSLDKFPELLEDKKEPEQVVKNNVEQSNF